MNLQIKKISSDAELEAILEVIHRSHATVAAEFGLTHENCPKHTSFLPLIFLQTQRGWGWIMAGLYDGEAPIGYVSLSDAGESAWELHNLSVIPEYRHNGCGKMLLDFAKDSVKEAGGSRIKIGIIEENARLRRWYEENGYRHIGIKKFEHLPFTTGFMELRI